MSLCCKDNECDNGRPVRRHRNARCHNDQEENHSFTFTTGNCHYVSSLSNSFPITAPRFETVITGDRTGWLKLWGTNDIGILGAKITVNPNVGLSEDAYNQGRNLHKLKLTRAAQITIPIFAPGC